MADTIKEFYDGTLTYASLKSGTAFITAGASVQQIIKEMLIRASAEHMLTLSMGSTKLLEWYGTGILRGTELVPATKSLSMSTPVRAIVNKMVTFQSTTVIRTWTFKTIFNDDGTSFTDTPTYTDETVTALSESAPDIIFFAPNGDFYYSARGTVTLYKRAGGANGAQTTIAFGGNLKVYDGSRYVYGFNTGGTGIITYDTQTGTVTNTAMTGGTNLQNQNNTLSKLCIIDGYIFHVGGTGTAGSQTGTYYSIATGAYKGSFTVTVAANVLEAMEINKAADGTYYLILFTNNSNGFQVNFGKDLASPNIDVSSFTASHGVAQSGPSGPNRALKNVDAPGIILGQGNSGGQLIIFDIVTATKVSTRTVTGLSLGVAYMPKLDEALASTDFGAVNIRAIGVEIS